MMTINKIEYNKTKQNKANNNNDKKNKTKKKKTRFTRNKSEVGEPYWILSTTWQVNRTEFCPQHGKWTVLNFVHNMATKEEKKKVKRAKHHERKTNEAIDYITLSSLRLFTHSTNKTTVRISSWNHAYLMKRRLAELISTQSMALSLVTLILNHKLLKFILHRLWANLS